jgi:hypothetical protein
MRRVFAAATLAVVCAATAAPVAMTATLSGASIRATPAEVGPDDVDFSFDVRNDSATPIATIAFQCFLRLPDRTPPVATMKGQYTFQRVVQPGEVRHEDLVINPFSPLGQAAQSLTSRNSFDCRTLSIVTSTGESVAAADSPAVASSVR